MNPTPAEKACPRCGKPVPGSAPAGLCPRCLLEGIADEQLSATSPHRVKPPSLPEVAAAFPALEVLGLLGAGGMGCVYRVRERESGRVAALKILPRELASDPAFVERFEREARTLSRLTHPHIVGIHGFGNAGGYCYLLMELVDGANLRQAIRSGRFTAAQALALIPPLCEALQYAHSQGVLHRDIKPENILLDADGCVKIADFGIAKILGESGTVPDDATLTRTGARLGTPHYMAPEQVEKPEQVDHRADIYSLGVVFYELLTGELPLGRFQVPSAKAALDARIDDIVLRALAKERELRQQSAEQVKAEVERLEVPRWWDRFRPKWWGWTPLAFALVALVLFRLGTVGAPELLILTVVITTIFGVRELQRRRPTWRVSLEIATVVLAMLIPSVVFSTNRLRDWEASKSQRIDVVNRLKNLGLVLRTSSVHTPEGEVFPKDLSFVLPELKTNPQTGEAFEYMAAGQTNPGPSTILVQTTDGKGGRVVLLADGSVQTFSEAEFQKRLEAESSRRSLDLYHRAFGPVLEPIEAERHLRSGGTVLRFENGMLRRCEIDVAAAFRAASRGDYHGACDELFRMRVMLMSEFDTEFVFTVPGLYGGLAKGDSYLQTQTRHGGLLAAMLVFAAKSGHSEALEFGRTILDVSWKDRKELVLCTRALNGNADQDFEEIRMKTADLQSLISRTNTIVTPRMTVIHRSKSYPQKSTTNVVDLAWPRGSKVAGATPGPAAEPPAGSPVNVFQMVEWLETEEVKQRVQGGETFAREGGRAFERVTLSLGEGLGALVRDDFAAANHGIRPLHAFLVGERNRDFHFVLSRNGTPSGPRLAHRRTASRHGGLLALAAVVAARAGDQPTLDELRNAGRPFWQLQDKLLICERGLEGDESRWEEIWIETKALLNALPGATLPMTVIQFSKVPGESTRTNVVMNPWLARP